MTEPRAANPYSTSPVSSYFVGQPKSGPPLRGAGGRYGYPVPPAPAATMPYHMPSRMGHAGGAHPSAVPPRLEPHFPRTAPPPTPPPPRASPSSQTPPPASREKPRGMPEAPRPASASSGGLDICFVMDCTGSMSPWIEASKQTIKDMIGALPREEQHRRVAFVGYRDFCDGPAEVHAFTEDVEDVVRFIDAQSAFGGGDAPEDVAGGLADALGLEWLSRTRTLVLIADAPCHGERYHGLHDDHGRGDPTGLSMTALLQLCRTSGVDFTFVQLTADTDQMQRLLRQHYEAASGPENISKFELRDLREIIDSVGGMGSIGDGTAAHVSTMLSAAITPTIQASYAQQQSGVQTYSAPVSRTYAAYSAGRGHSTL